MTSINKYKSIIFYGSILIIALIFTFVFAYCCKDCCFADDDFFYLRYRFDESIIDCFRFKDHGSGNIGIFIGKFLSFNFPVLLNIHPYDVIGLYSGIFRGICTSIVILLTANHVNFFKKSNALHILLYILIGLYFFINFVFQENIYVSVSYSFYRYFFPLLFFALFWFYTFDNVLNERKFSKIKLILLCICAFFIGTAVEITYFASITLAFLLIIYNLILFICSKILKNENIFANNKLFLNRNFYIPLIFLSGAISLSVTAEQFLIVSADRGLSDININLSFISEFCKIYKQIIFSNEIIYWIAFIIFLIISYVIAHKNKELKILLLPIFFQTSVLIVLFSLVLCKDTFLGSTWLENSKIILLYKYLILFPFLYLISYLYKNIGNNKRTNIILTTILIIFFLIFTFGNNIKNSSDIRFFDYFHYNKLTENKKCAYIYQKIIRFYTLKKQVPKIPKELIEYSFPELNEGIEQKEKEIYSDYLIYKDENILKYGYEVTDGTLDDFYNDGGSFNNEELNNIKFSRLFDKEFVLNEKK